MYLNTFQKIQETIANILPGWKTVTLAGGLGAINLLDWLQMQYQTLPWVMELVPEPYKTIMNVAVPALIMFLKNISQRAEIARLEAAKLPG